jgi:hypothetical protein
MGPILNMILIGWIVYYICVLEEDVSQLRMVSLSKINANNTIEEGGPFLYLIVSPFNKNNLEEPRSQISTKTRVLMFCLLINRRWWYLYLTSL